jgi:serine/threonine-protein kinase
MGVVYEALDLQLERSVAIKSLKVRGNRPSQLKRFLREARITSRLNHPGVMAIHEFGQTGDGRAFMVMRLLRGQTLRQILDARAGAADDLPRLLAAFLQACQAVAYAHAAGVIHRDLKPANIMVGEYSLVTVMDWGLAKLLDDPQPDVVFSDEDREETLEEFHTACGTVFGTPGYLAPEQARGEIDRVDRRTDVFGLGCILCEILTGVPAYRGTTPVEVWRQAEEGDTAATLARLEACDGPEALLTLARACLAIDPEQRPADAGEIVEALVAHLESGQRRAEQELVRFFDLSVDLFCVAGLDGFFRRVNDNAIRLLGHPESVLLSRKFLDFVHPDDQATTLAEVEKLGRGETTHRFCNRYRCADGRFVTLEWNARAVPDEGVIYAVARDVTERVRLENDLAKSRRDVDDFMENANVPLHRVDERLARAEAERDALRRRLADLEHDARGQTPASATPERAS